MPAVVDSPASSLGAAASLGSSLRDPSFPDSSFADPSVPDAFRSGPGSADPSGPLSRGPSSPDPRAYPESGRRLVVSESGVAGFSSSSASSDPGRTSGIPGEAAQLSEAGRRGAAVPGRRPVVLVGVALAALLTAGAGYALTAGDDAGSTRPTVPAPVASAGTPVPDEHPVNDVTPAAAVPTTTSPTVAPRRRKSTPAAPSRTARTGKPAVTAGHGNPGAGGVPNATTGRPESELSAH